MQFKLHPQLAEDCFLIKLLNLSQVLLMNDARFPWLILVPMRLHIKELYELTGEDQQLLLSEILTVSKCIKTHFNADKMNIASLGNKVEQCHVHIIARFKGDPAWPSPVWGFQKPIPYEPEDAKALVEILHEII